MSGERGDVSTVVVDERSNRTGRASLWNKVRNILRKEPVMEDGLLARAPPSVRRDAQHTSKAFPVNSILRSLSPNAVFLSKKYNKQVLDCIEREGSRTGTSTTANRYASILRSVASSLDKSGRDWRVFDFGLECQLRNESSLASLGSIFGEDRIDSKHQSGPILSLQSPDGSPGIVAPYECFRDAYQVAQWITTGGFAHNQAGSAARAALVLAPSKLHLDLVLTALRLLLSPSRGAAQDIIEAHALYLSLYRGMSLVDFGRNQSDGENRTSSTSSRAARPLQRLMARCNNVLRPPHKQPTGSESESIAVNSGPGGTNSSKDKDAPGSLMRAITTIGELRKAAPVATVEASETIAAKDLFWRKLVLRKIIISQQTGAMHNRSTLRPYVMVMSGDQSRFIYSTMVQGVKALPYGQDDEMSFDINCKVDRDIVVKVYHLEPGAAGLLLCKLHLSVCTAEPAESTAVFQEFPKGEQLVMVSVAQDRIEKYEAVDGYSLGSAFQVQALFGMQELDRALHPSGPKGFHKVLNPTPTGISSAVVPPLELHTPHLARLPPLQTKCTNLMCAQTQYIPQRSHRAQVDHESNQNCQDGAESPRAGSYSFSCYKCKQALTISACIDQLDQSIQRAPDQEEALGDQEQVLHGEDNIEQESAVNESAEQDSSSNDRTQMSSSPETSEDRQNRSHWDVVEEGLLSTMLPQEESDADEQGDQGAESASAANTTDASEATDSPSAFDAEAVVQARVEYVCSILPFLGRQNVEAQLRAAFSVCASSDEADLAVQALVASAFGDEDDGLPMRSRRASSSSSRQWHGPGSLSSLSGDLIADIAAAHDNGPMAMRQYFLMPSLGVSGSGRAYEARHMGLFSRGYRRRHSGLGMTLLSQLPTHTYEVSVNANGPKKCSVCLCEFEQGDTVRNLPCFHTFHDDCIVQWLADSTKCPICQRDVTQTEM